MARRGSWLDFEFDHNDCVFVRIDRRRKLPVSVIFRAMGFSTEEVLDTFFDHSEISYKSGKFVMKLVPEQLKGQSAAFDITDGKEVFVKAGKKITARTVKQLQEAKIKSIIVPDEFLVGKVLSSGIMNEETGELVARANEVMTADLVETIKGIKGLSFKVLFIDDLENGAYISDTLNLDTTTSQLEAQIEIYRMMRPGEPPTKESSEALFNSLFFDDSRYDLSSVGRMKLNRRLGRKDNDGSLVLENEDIVDVVKELLNIRNGLSTIDDFDTLGNRPIRAGGEKAENAFRVGLVRVERAVKKAFEPKRKPDGVATPRTWI